MRSLLQYTNKLYILAGIILYLSLLFFWHLPYLTYNLIAFFTFLTYAIIILASLNLKENKYTSQRLAFTVFFYSLLFVSIYMAVSYYYMGNTFIFSEVDARLYEGWSYSIKDLTYEQKLSQLSSYEELEFDDWGAPLTMSFILKILPYKEFLNFIYIILNTVSTCMLFAIGKTIMDKRYSYVGPHQLRQKMVG